MLSVKKFEFELRIAPTRAHPVVGYINYPINLVDPVYFKY